MYKYNRGSNCYYKTHIREFDILQRFFKSTDTRDERIKDILAEQNRTVRFAKLASLVFLGRTELKINELCLQALIGSSPPLS
jgi:hypothetical protein